MIHRPCSGPQDDRTRQVWADAYDKAAQARADRSAAAVRAIQADLAATLETIRQVPTPQLQPGDIVLAHGMRIKLDQPPLIWHAEYDCDPARRGHPESVMTHEYCRLAYSWLGTVTNVEDTRAAGVVPIGWLRRDGYPGEYRWNVQGNSLATWTVERAAPIALEA